MSRSNNTEVFNPAKKFYEWVGSKGVLKYYDKEQEKEIFVGLPFSFLVLDRLHTIKGFSQQDNSSFWSNEVRDLQADPLTIRTRKRIAGSGLYGNLAHVLNQGAQYAQSVYIGTKETNGKIVMCNLALFGSAIGPWIDLCKGKDIYKYVITIAGATPMKKGTTNYFTPAFKLSPNVTPETDKQCIELDKELQKYLNTYLKRSKTEVQENITPADTVTNKQRRDIADMKPEYNIDTHYEEVNAMLQQDAEQKSLFEGSPTDMDIEDVSDDLPF